jgi:hypothetical protein
MGGNMPPFIRQMNVHQGTPSEISFGYFSIGLRVGPKAFNDDWDVMLVQAMLRFLSENERGTPNQLCPLVTGNYDELTARAIWNFQKTHNLEADWYIDPLPPHYQSIVINQRQNTVFTMAKLYILVMEKAVFEPLKMNPVIEVLRILTNDFPQLEMAATIMKENAMDAGVF